MCIRFFGFLKYAPSLTLFSMMSPNKYELGLESRVIQSTQYSWILRKKGLKPSSSKWLASVSSWQTIIVFENNKMRNSWHRCAEDHRGWISIRERRRDRHWTRYSKRKHLKIFSMHKLICSGSILGYRPQAFQDSSGGFPCSVRRWKRSRP